MCPLVQFAQDKNLLNAEYISLSEKISCDPEKPTVFDVIGNVSVSQGAILFDLVRWDTQIAGIALSTTYHGQATGYIKDRIFCGLFKAEYESTAPSIPEFRLNMYGQGKFEIELDGR